MSDTKPFEQPDPDNRSASDNIVHDWSDDMTGAKAAVAGPSALGARTPRRIIVGTSPRDTRVNEIRALLKMVRPARSGAAVPGDQNAFSESLVFLHDPSDAEALRRALHHDPDSVVLLFMGRPASVIAHALSEGNAPSAAAESWRTATERLLVIADTEPNTAVVVTDDALYAPAALAAFLSDWMSWPLRVIDYAAAVSTTSRWEDVLLLAATQYVQDRPELASLADELEQRRNFLPPASAKTIDGVSVIQDIHALRQENTVLLDLLHRLQIELEQNAQTLGQREDELRSARQDAADRLQQIRGLQKQLEQNARTHSQSAEKLGKQAKSGKQQIQKLSRELKQRDADLLRISRQLDAIQHSTTWRVSAPMRRLIDSVKRRSER